MSAAGQSQCAVRVILFRPTGGDGFDIYLRRGGPESDYDFPGRDIARDDCREAMLRRCRGLSAGQARKCFGSELRPELIVGHWVAAIRALFEEVGVLFCVSEPKDPTQITGREERLAAARRELASGRLGFRDFLESEGLLCDLTRLVYFSQWLDPVASLAPVPTRHFLGQLPRNQAAVPAGWQFPEALWITPERALKEHRRQMLPLAFPAFATLRTLADFESWRSLCEEYGLRAEEDPQGS